MFGTILPITPSIAFVALYAKIYLDNKGLSQMYERPKCEMASGIGQWN